MAAARDGSLQLRFGLGKYVNRNVLDAYAGISRGVEQITVRASRRLSPEPERTIIGPIRYEVDEPLHTVRFVLEPNVRFRGQAGEQATMFFRDPSGNALEIKAMRDPADGALPRPGRRAGDDVLPRPFGQRARD